MARIAHELLADLDKDTVDFVPNYDDNETEPSVLPARVPNLLVNGSAGIAVGMATNIPPHNLGEVLDACIATIDRPEITIEELLAYLPAPDFPTGGRILGRGGVRQAYETGRGRIYVRAVVDIEEPDADRQRLVVRELPYQVNKARLLERIAELHKEKRVEGIANLRDESDKDGMRVVIELRRGTLPEIVLNNLYQHTQLQTVFGINLVALVDAQPRLLNLKQLIDAVVRHRREVVTRRTLYELAKARDRAHVLEGLAVALANIDPVIALIRGSASRQEAREGLMARTWEPGVVTSMLERAGAGASRPDDLDEGFGLVAGGYRLSERQAQAILDLRLHQLTALEQDKLIGEYNELLDRINDYLEILSDPDRLRAEVRGELVEVKERFGAGDPRRTEISDEDVSGLDRAALIAPEDVVVTLSHSGYTKWQPLDAYSAQRRGGRGKTAATTKEEDFVDQLFVANTHDTILCFSSRGKVYWLKVYDLPQASRTARGSPIVNLLPSLEPGERISAILSLQDFAPGRFVLMATASGVVKKTPLEDFSRPRSSGIIAVDLLDDDHLVGALLTDGDREAMLAASDGRLIRFHEEQVRSMGRTARGVRGMRLPPGVQIISLMVAEPGLVLSATENGYGKCTPVDDYRAQLRGGQGLISIQCSDRNGQVVAARLVKESDEIMLITDGGTLVRTRVDEIRVQGRNTQGVRLIRLTNGEKLVGLERVIDED